MSYEENKVIYIVFKILLIFMGMHSHICVSAFDTHIKE